MKGMKDTKSGKGLGFFMLFMSFMVVALRPPIHLRRALRSCCTVREGQAMKKEYDFSKGVRGKFYRPDTKLRIPVYLDPDAADFLRKVAYERGTDVERIVNDWIRRDIDLIKSVT